MEAKITNQFLLDGASISLSVNRNLFNLIVINIYAREIEFGEYPQSPVEKELAEELERCYISDNAIRQQQTRPDNDPIFKLKRTGRTFTLIQNNLRKKSLGERLAHKKPYLKNKNYQIGGNLTLENKFQEYPEYEYKGNKYIREIRDNKPFWRIVQPIKWDVNNTSRQLITKDTIFGIVKKLETSSAGIWSDSLNDDRERTLEYINKIVVPDILRTTRITETISYLDYNDLISILSREEIANYEGLVEFHLIGPRLREDEKDFITEMLGGKCTFNEKITDNERSQEVNAIKSQINELLALGIYDKPDEIRNRMNAAKQKYEKAINDVRPEDKKSISLSFGEDEPQDFKSIFATYFGELEDILKNISKAVAGNKDYLEMLKLVNGCIDIIEGYSTVAHNDLEGEMLAIKNDILPNILDAPEVVPPPPIDHTQLEEAINNMLLAEKGNSSLDPELNTSQTVDIEPASNVFLGINDNALSSKRRTIKKEKLLGILYSKKNEILALIKGQKTPENKDFESLHNFRRRLIQDISTFLRELQIEAENKEAAKKVKDLLPNLLENQFIQSSNDYINTILKEISKNVQIIKDEGTEQENERLREIIKGAKISTIDDIVSLLSKVLRIVVDVEERVRFNEQKAEYELTEPDINDSVIGKS